ncbi:MAG: hypothetical protein HY508_07880 [Acidobacteria bacterium]|nr:hypothetical protein [Acidobacteriota bacterium]
MNGDYPLVAQEIRPGRWLYGLAAVIFVAGWAMFAIVLWKSLSGLDEGLQQVVVPGTAELNLAKPGSYTIFHEHESVVGSRIYSGSETVSGLECSLRSKATGAAVKLSRSTANTHYSTGGRSGVSFLEFRIEQPGVYELSAEYPEGKEGPEIVLAVGQGVGLRIVTGILGSLAIVFGCIGVAIALVVYTGVMRYRAGQRIRNPHTL